jgi:CHAT domain-containing protein
MIRRCWLLGAVLAGALFGCQSPPPEAFVSSTGQSAAPSAVPIGNDDSGEPCRYQLASGEAAAVAARRDAVIYCGPWEQPKSHVFELAETADPARLDALARSGPWRTYIDQRFACDAPVQTRVLGGAPAVLMQCTRRTGGWPHLAMVTVVGGRTFAADAVRPALPALEATIAALTGEAVPAAAASGSEVRRLIEQRAGGASFGSGDEGRFFQQIRLGDAYNNIDDPTNAERAYREALAIQQKILGPNDPGLALTMMKLAAQLAHEQSGAEAEGLLAKAGQLIENRGEVLPAAQLDFYRATVSAYEGKTKEALDLAQRAEAAFARLSPDAVSKMQRGEASTPGRQGVLREGGLETLMSDESPTTTENRAAVSGLAEAMRLRATLLQYTGNMAEAAALGRRIRRLLEASGLSVSSTQAHSLRLLAGNQAITGGYPEASGTSAEADRVYQRITPGERPTAANLLNEGYYLLKSNRVDAALDSFRKAGAILHNLTGTGGARPGAINAWLDTIYAASGDSVQRAGEMFEVAQFARTGRTAKDIAQATARLIAGDPKVAEAIRAYEDRKREFDRLQSERDRAVGESAPADRIAAVDKQIEAAKEASDEAATAISAAAPRYLAAVEKPAALSELQALLGADEAFVFFFVADTGSYGFLIRPSGATAYKIPLTSAEIAQLVDRLRDTTVAKPGGLPTLDFAASYRLYSALFGPVEQQLEGVARMSIAATGDLLRYPLEALVTRSGVSDENGDYRQVPFLLRRLALSYVPAPRILVNIRKGHAVGSDLRPFIGFGDFRPATAAQLTASFPPGRCGEDYRLLQGLRPLPETRTQVTTIAQQLGAGPGDVVLGEAFTKERLAAPDLGQYRIVLLATHAFLPTNTLRCITEPAITVSAPPGAPNAGGEFERVRDVEKLKLNADLVALSACDTAGAGGGESLSGLARAFFRAGAHGLLVSHWDVVTGASVPLMIGTFGAGGGTRDSAQALRAAQLRLIESAGSSTQAPIEISHPNYWAAFVLIGDGVRAAPGA